MIHTGSRGLGHQVCTDYLDGDRQRRSAGTASACPTASSRARRSTPTRRATTWARCARRRTSRSPTGRCSRTRPREVFERVLGAGAARARHARRCTTSPTTSPRRRSTRWTGAAGACSCTARAPRAPFPGQPVLVPGDMGRYSYLLIGTETAMRETFGSHLPRRRPADEPDRGGEGGPRPANRRRAAPRAAWWRGPPAATRSPRRCRRRTRTSATWSTWCTASASRRASRGCKPLGGHQGLSRRSSSAW